MQNKSLKRSSIRKCEEIFKLISLYKCQTKPEKGFNLQVPRNLQTDFTLQVQNKTWKGLQFASAKILANWFHFTSAKQKPEEGFNSQVPINLQTDFPSQDLTGQESKIQDSMQPLPHTTFFTATCHLCSPGVKGTKSCFKVSGFNVAIAYTFISSKALDSKLLMAWG